MAAKKLKPDPGAALRQRAARRGYTLHEEKDGWYVAIGDTRIGPFKDLDEVESTFLPKGAA